MPELKELIKQKFLLSHSTIYHAHCLLTLNLRKATKRSVRKWKLENPTSE